ncbi:hypothetical protein H2202_000415 [Exophiala xenobiotica]|nr:hypothetical protein H2202_000415 [Exophiala xenobiotica]KAK5194061.1 hypothetical protein LTR92_006401 [Exophiala xenobiotica]KAK5222701.1 hypothetical protein LTR72_005538 [Exophiala xenobiotica]KAK5233726.1 hypothetical protein LTR47_005349 [Exophiala xenobiotica]KAK5247946.1 hypothetical protein LTS06_006935 [Exophiala xenobiotica]
MGWSRGRSRILRHATSSSGGKWEKARWAGHETTHQLGLKPQWSSKNAIVEVEEEEGLIFRTDKEATGHDLDTGGQRQANRKLKAYPSYLELTKPAGVMIKGSTCKLVMQMHEEEDLSASRISRKVARKTKTDYYSAAEIEEMIQTCASLGLDGCSPLATEYWENEPIEGWWLKEESYCEDLRRQLPVSEEICGYDCNDGWWRDKQKQEDRDWYRFGDRSIGPESQRRRS